MSEFQKKYGPWALVTGASSGIGAAFARQLAERRLNLVLVARRADRLRALADELQMMHSIETLVVPADLSREDFLEEIAGATEGLDIHLLVNNAGTGTAGNFLGNDLEAEIRALNLNCRAPLILTHHYGKTMQQRGRGGVIFLSSIVAFAGLPSWSNYASTKAQNLLFAEGLAAELRRDGVDVLALCPGFTRTELLTLTGFGRMMAMDPGSVVRVALRQLGRKQRVTTGLLNKAIVLSTRLQPRLLSSRIFGTVFNRVRDTRVEPRAGVSSVPEPPAPVSQASRSTAPVQPAPVQPEPVAEPTGIASNAPAAPPEVAATRPDAVAASDPEIVRKDAERSPPQVDADPDRGAPVPEETPEPRPALVIEAVDDDRPATPPRRRPRYTPPPKSSIRGKH